jgi:hypothetical protein
MSFLHYAYPFYVDSGAGFDDGGRLSELARMDARRCTRVTRPGDMREHANVCRDMVETHTNKRFNKSAPKIGQQIKGLYACLLLRSSVQAHF